MSNTIGYVVRIPELIGIIMMIWWSVKITLAYVRVRQSGETILGIVKGKIASAFAMVAFWRRAGA